MIKKLAVLVIEKADGTVDLQAGERGEIREFARELIRSLNDSPDHDVAQVTALDGGGILKRRKWKQNWPAEPVALPVSAPDSVAPAVELITEEPAEPAGIGESDELPEFEGDLDEQADATEEDEAKALRKKLRDAGISYSPRSGLDLLRKLVADHGL